MEKLITVRSGIFLSLIWLLTQCTFASKEGTIVLDITDAPLDGSGITGVYVTITGIYYKEVEAENWQAVERFGEARTINLLELTNGTTTNLGAYDLPVGDYEGLRFELRNGDNNAYLTMSGGSQEPLEITGGTGSNQYFATGAFTVPFDGTVELTADFDARKSVSQTGNGRYLLSPTIRIVDNRESGHINATISGLSKSGQCSVFAYPVGTFSFDEINDHGSGSFHNSETSDRVESGVVELAYLPQGNYDLIFVQFDDSGAYQEIFGELQNVLVDNGTTTTISVDADVL